MGTLAPAPGDQTRGERLATTSEEPDIINTAFVCIYRINSTIQILNIKLKLR